VDWVEGALVETALLEDYDFLFLTSEHTRHPDITDNYRLYHGRARMHWTPESLSWRALADGWLMAVPAPNRSSPELAERTRRARFAWRAAWRYFVYREVPDASDMRLPAPSYYFAVRRDLATDLPD
jgi:hypothetical protein